MRETGGGKDPFALLPCELHALILGFAPPYMRVVYPFVFRWYSLPPTPEINYSLACDLAAAGELNLLQWVVDQGLHPFYWKRETACTAAAKGGHLDVIIWLRSQLIKDNPSNDQLNGANPSNDQLNGAISEGAAEFGHKHVIEWLLNNYGIMLNDDVMTGAAAIGGQTELLDWWKQKAGAEFSCGISAISGVAANGHVETLDWLKRNGNFDENDYYVEVLRGALAAGRLEVLKWWVKVTRKKEEEERETKCERGKESEKEEEEEKEEETLDPEQKSLLSSLYEYALHGGSVDTLEWLAQSDAFEWRDHHLNTAGFYGQLHVIQWAAKRWPDEWRLYMWWSYAYAGAKQGEHEEIMKWIEGQEDITVTEEAIQNAEGWSSIYGYEYQ